MMRVAMSPAAAGLLRGVLARGGVDRDRILLTEFRSTDWQLLTFVGERHDFQLRVAGADASAILSQILTGLDEAEFESPGHLLADIAVAQEPCRQGDGSMTVGLEALTVAQD